MLPDILSGMPKDLYPIPDYVYLVNDKMFVDTFLTQNLPFVLHIDSNDTPHLDYLSNYQILYPHHITNHKNLSHIDCIKT